MDYKGEIRRKMNLF